MAQLGLGLTTPPNGTTINLIDAVGIGLSATKGLAERVRALAHAA